MARDDRQDGKKKTDDVVIAVKVVQPTRAEVITQVTTAKTLSELRAALLSVIDLIR